MGAKDVVNVLDPNDPDIQLRLVNLYNKTKGKERQESKQGL